MRDRIGFVGLGVMGMPMARNLLGAGYQLTVHNRTRAKADALGAEGAEIADDPRQVAGDADVVITMLPDTPDVHDVVTGDRGILAGLGDGGMLVDMSTISPTATRDLAAKVRERGATMVDAPVSGGDIGAIEGTLSIMAGGEPAAFERARPLFEVLGRTVTHVGPIGAGQVVKAANQVAVGLIIQAVSEALVLGARGGVAPETILDVLAGGLAGNKVIETKREKLLSHAFPPGFRAELHHKDLGIALATARDYGVALPATAIVDQLLQTMERKGWGGDDHSALLKVIEDLAQFECSSPDRSQ